MQCYNEGVTGNDPSSDSHMDLDGTHKKNDNKNKRGKTTSITKGYMGHIFRLGHTINVSLNGGPEAHPVAHEIPEVDGMLYM